MINDILTYLKCREDISKPLIKINAIGMFSLYHELIECSNIKQTIMAL